MALGDRHGVGKRSPPVDCYSNIPDRVGGKGAEPLLRVSAPRPRTLTLAPTGVDRDREAAELGPARVGQEAVIGGCLRQITPRDETPFPPRRVRGQHQRRQYKFPSWASLASCERDDTTLILVKGVGGAVSSRLAGFSGESGTENSYIPASFSWNRSLSLREPLCKVLTPIRAAGAYYNLRPCAGFRGILIVRSTSRGAEVNTGCRSCRTKRCPNPSPRDASGAPSPVKLRVPVSGSSPAGDLTSTTIVAEKYVQLGVPPSRMYKIC